MAEPSGSATDSTFSGARRPSLLRSALGLLRPGRPPRDAGPTIRGMFADPSRGEAPAEAGVGDEPDAAAMRQALKQELGRVNGSRYVLRHLAMIEHELKSRGLDLFDQLPVRVLQQASIQLESLVQSPVSPGVAALRSRLSFAILSRERVERPTERPSERPTERAAERRAERPAEPPPEAPGYRRAGGPQPAAPGSPAAARRAPVRAASLGTPGVASVGTPVSASTFAALMAWDGAQEVEVSEASVDDFEKATTDWQLLDEPRPR
jgi:hypothetical protein